MSCFRRQFVLVILAALLSNPVAPAFADSLGKIISDTVTSSNRIVVAEKDGVQKRAIIPLTMANSLTDDQILYSLFYTNPPPKQSHVTLNQHLTFYGLTVDDKTNVLSGVTVSGSALVMDNKTPGHQVPVETTSDGNGRFQFEVDYGQEVMISVSDGTNYISPPTRWFRYPPGWYGPMDSPLISTPDINSPVVFVLTKKQKPESLIGFRKGFTAPNTGEPVRVDLISGKIVSTGGDLIVSINCPEPYSELKRSSWSVSVEVIDGGLIQVSNPIQHMEYLLEAPVDGYTNGFEVDYASDSVPYRRQYEGWYYVKSRNGAIYAKMYFDMNTFWDARGVPFGIWAEVNTNGSRNLQNVSQ